MAEGRIPTKSVKVAEFAKVELLQLVESIATKYPELKVEDGALMSALILGALRSPPETVAALLSTYWERDKEFEATVAVCGFLHAYRP